MSKKVAFLYGFGEGRWHGKRFTKALLARGYEVVTELHDADIVVAHSAGCYYVPLLQDRQKLLLIGPTYWPGKSRFSRAQALIRSYVCKVLPTRRGPYLVVKSCWNIFYLFSKPGRTLDIIRRSKHYNMQESIRHHQTILVRNADDTWIRPNLENLKQKFPSLIIRHLPGDHDDCWYNPEP